MIVVRPYGRGLTLRIIPAALAAAVILWPVHLDERLELIKLEQKALSESIKQITRQLANTGKELVSLHDLSALARVTVTAYHPVVEQCDDTPWVTASGAPSRPGHTAAVSRLLKERLKLKWGDLVVVPDHGVFVVQDLMASRWQDDRLDLMIPIGTQGFKELRNIVFLRQ